MQWIVSVRGEQPAIGGRKLLYLLRQEFPPEQLMGRDSFFDFLGKHGLLVRRRKRKAPLTTNSWHHFHKYPNLYNGKIPDGPNQVWVADITYIRLFNGDFLYLSLLTDAYSHKIVGWYLSDTLSMQGSLEALKQALVDLPDNHSLIHHSDRGVQYCSNDYTKQLKSRHIGISMTENSDPRENAIAERVNGILKSEWIDRECITSLKQGRKRIASIVAIYNNKRPHLSIDMLTPAQAHQRQGKLERKWKTYYKKQANMEEEKKEEEYLKERELDGSSG